MFEVLQTDVFADWLASLRDRRPRAAILERVQRLALGHRGDVKALGEGLVELRLFLGPGYRVYATKREGRLIVPLRGGDKGSQARDIRRARKLMEELD